MRRQNLAGSKPHLRSISLLRTCALLAALGACGGDGARPSGPPPVVVATVEIKPDSASVLPGDSILFKATARDAQGAAVVGASITWSTSDASVARVSSAGWLVGIAPGGPVRVSAAAATGTAGSALVTVSRPSIASIAVTPSSKSVIENDTIKLSAVARDSRGVGLFDRTFIWTSRDTNVARVSAKGTVTGVAPGGPVTVLVASEGVSDSARITVTRGSVAVVAVSLSAKTAARGRTVQASATVLDVQGRALKGRTPAWSVSDTTRASITPTGLVTPRDTGTVWVLASVEGKVGSASLTVTLTSFTETEMLAAVPGIISWALTTNQDLIPRNPTLVPQIQAKIAILQRPGLAGEITAGHFYSEGSAPSRSGAAFTIGAVFMVDSMRAGADSATRALQRGPAILEDFFDTSVPARDIRIWYGFNMGNLGGGGVLYMEDRGTYEARTPSNRLPWDAILFHELSHSYIGHESLNQFLELYQYNVVLAGSKDLARWVFTRSYRGPLDQNTGIHAILDIYQLIGPDAMAKAYRTLYRLQPPYGQPLSAEGQKAFVDQAPDAVKAQVAAKAAKVTT